MNNPLLYYRLYIPPQVWAIAMAYGHMLAVKAEFPNMWVDLSLTQMQMQTEGFLAQHRALWEDQP